jgi:hypothetical protein
MLLFPPLRKIDQLRHIEEWLNFFYKCWYNHDIVREMRLWHRFKIPISLPVDEGPGWFRQLFLVFWIIVFAGNLKLIRAVEKLHYYQHWRWDWRIVLSWRIRFWRWQNEWWSEEWLQGGLGGGRNWFYTTDLVLVGVFALRIEVTLRNMD